MGSFYCNVTLLGTHLEAVRAAAPQPAFLFSEGDAVVVFAQGDDEGAPTSGSALSADLKCVALSVCIHDDDIFFFEVHDRGRAVMRGAVPDPAEYFGTDGELIGDLVPSMLEESGGPPVPGQGGGPDPGGLVAAVGRGDVAAVRTALETDFAFASERHHAIATALGLPLGAVGWGFKYLSRDSDTYPGPPLVLI